MHWIAKDSREVYWDANATVPHYGVRGRNARQAAQAFDDMYRALCAPRYAGEMYTSAAPWDPLFWLVHPTSERLLQYRRLIATRDVGMEFDETWGYMHDDQTPSDTGVVCDCARCSGPCARARRAPAAARTTRCRSRGRSCRLIDGRDALFTHREFYERVLAQPAR